MQNFWKDSFGWGFLLWLCGYVLGVILFMLVSPLVMSFVITIIWSAFAIWILLKKIASSAILYYAKLGVVWVCVAIVCDYFFLVKLFNPVDGYYKTEIYLYYALSFLLPILVGLVRSANKQK